MAPEDKKDEDELAKKFGRDIINRSEDITNSNVEVTK
jgi:hypothetical protein